MADAGVKSVKYDDFIEERDRFVREINEAVDRRHGRICGHRASLMVDYRICVSAETGLIGLRFDNSFGVVGGEDAVKFTRAQYFVARKLAKFPYLGYKIGD